MKKFILKPGNHQFVPGSHATHNNLNLTDDDAAWYLKAYPHIANLFEKMPTDEELIEIKLKRDTASITNPKSSKSIKPVADINAEDLYPS